MGMERNRQRCHSFLFSQMRNPSLSKVVVRCKTRYTGLFSFLAIPLLMGDIMIEFMNMIDINVEIMITTVTTTTATTMATEPNNNNNNNGAGGGGGSGPGNNNNN